MVSKRKRRIQQNSRSSRKAGQAGQRRKENIHQSTASNTDSTSEVKHEENIPNHELQGASAQSSASHDGTTPNTSSFKFDGLYLNGEKSGRGKLFDENNIQFIEGEWANDCLVQLYNAQFQIVNNDYVCLYGLNNLYTSTKDNFVARILWPPLTKHYKNFDEIRRDIESNITVIKVLDDDVKTNLDTSRNNLKLLFRLRKYNVVVSRIALRDMFHLFLIIQNYSHNPYNNNENIKILNKISDNKNISLELRDQVKNVCQAENKYNNRNKILSITMNQNEIIFSWVNVISEFITGSIANLKVNLTKSLPTKAFIPSGHEDINNLLDRQLFTCSVENIQLFSDLELTIRQYSKTESYDYFQDFAQNYVHKLWELFISKIRYSHLYDIPSKSPYTNPVFLQLFKTFSETLILICADQQEDMSKLIDVKSDGYLCITKNVEVKSAILENRLKFLISLMNHFKPSDLKKSVFKYKFSFFKVNDTILKRLTGFVINYFDHSLPNNIPQEYVIWLYLIHQSFSHILNNEKYRKNEINKQEFISFLNSVMNLFKIVIENQEISLEKVRILANSIVKFGTTISPYFLNQSSINDDEMNILLKQAQYIKDFISIEKQTANDVTINIVDIYQVFWEERKNLFTDLEKRYSSWPIAVQEIAADFNSFMQYVFDLKIYKNKFLMFLRSYNEFMRLLRGTDFTWYVKKEDLLSENFVQLVDNNVTSYIVQDTENFVKLYLDKDKKLPRHFLFDVSKNLLSCVKNFMQNNSWAESDKLQAAGELLLLMGRSLINFNRLSSAVDFQHFFNIFTEPFLRVTQHSTNVNDFKKRLGSLENYYKYTMELNVMSVTKALELIEQKITSNSLINYSFNMNQIKLTYKVYETKFKNYVEKYILEPDFNIYELAKKVRTKTRSIDIRKWNSEYKVLELPKLVAGLSAVWSALESEDVVCQKQVIKPHCIQILCVLRLLGADQAGVGVASHLAQVLTGQGKSLVLALLAAALALTGNQVRVVCYNQHLAQRDQLNFSTFFNIFDIEAEINYGTFDNMADEILEINSNGIKYDVNKFVEKLIKGEQLYLSSEEKTELNTVLLIDEVDVFFSAQFYGNTLNRGAFIKSVIFAELQLKIWNLTSNIIDKTELIENIQKYIDETFSHSTDRTFVNIVRNSRNILNYHVDKMICDALNVRYNNLDNSFVKKFKLRDDGRLIKIQANGEHSTNTYNGYNNIFMYFKLKKNNFDHKNLQNYGYLNITCGSVSYALLPKDYHTILGVTGTLKQLSDVEMRAVASYGISRGSDMPTFFGSSKLRVTGFTILDTVDTWVTAILDSILSTMEEGRAVIVFFEDEHMIEQVRGKFTSHLSRYSVLTGNEASEEVATCVEEAGVARRVTVATRHMGRGVDFQANDSAVQSKGGVHVIQTFFSDDVKEETQIKGRTARKDNSGSYEAILCRGHLTEAGYECTANSYNELNAARTNKALEQGKTLALNIQKSQQKHDATMEFLRSLCNYDPAKRKEYFQKYPFIDL